MGPYGTRLSVEAMLEQQEAAASYGAPDHALRAILFCKRHRGVTITATEAGWEATWLEAVPGPRDGEVTRVTRELLGHLLDCLEAHFGGVTPPPGHLVTPRKDTVYSAGPRRAGRPADPGNELHYPLEAVCEGCDGPIELREFLAVGEGGEWQHRKD